MWFVPAVSIVCAAAVIVALVAIFGYKNRPRQIKMVTATQIMTLVFMLILFGGFFLAGDFEILGASGADIPSLLVFLLPVAAYILFYLARRSIQRDIELVKSMDRLR